MLARVGDWSASQQQSSGTNTVLTKRGVKISQQSNRLFVWGDAMIKSLLRFSDGRGNTLDENCSGLSTGRYPTRRSRQEVIEISRVEWDRVRRCLVSHGTGRVGTSYLDST